MADTKVSPVLFRRKSGVSEDLFWGSITAIIKPDDGTKMWCKFEIGECNETSFASLRDTSFAIHDWMDERWMDERHSRSSTWCGCVFGVNGKVRGSYSVYPEDAPEPR